MHSHIRTYMNLLLWITIPYDVCYITLYINVLFLMHFFISCSTTHYLNGVLFYYIKSIYVLYFALSLNLSCMFDYVYFIVF